MSRPPLPLGSWGAITLTELAGDPPRWKARARLRYRNGAIKEIARFAATKTGARTALMEALQAEALRHSPSATGSTSAVTDSSPVTNLLTTYMATMEREGVWAPRSSRIYRSNFSNHAEELLGGLAVRELSVPTLDTLTAELSPGVRQTLRALVGGAWTWGLKTGRLTTPTPVIRGKGEAKRTPAVITTVTAAEAKAFIKAAESYSIDPELAGPTTRALWLPAALAMGLGTGARAQELVTLRWADLHRVDETGEEIEGVSWDDGTQGVATAIVVHGVKKGKAQGKLGGAPRRVTLPPFALEALQSWRKQQPTESIFPWIFPTATGQHLGTASLHRGWRGAKTYAEQRNITVIESNHVCRRTAATWVAAELGDDAASRFLGHSGTSVARRHYLGAELIQSGDALQRRWDR